MQTANDHAPAIGAPAGPEEMIIDLFAGGGGASTGIYMATGRHPDVAVNHDPQAVALHSMNHPETRHYCCDVFEVDPLEACSDLHGNLRPVGLLWASPDCTHHSKARGGKPAEKKIRALAWVVVKWASKVRPRCIFLENVEEFQDWGPLDPDNRPDKGRRGEIFRLWVSQLEALGYVVDWRELVAADFGAPTTRKRLSLVARCDGRPIVWPEPTHAPRHKLTNPGLFDKPLKPWRAAADIIDWSLPCPSIFDRKKALAPKTQARIAKGLRRFVIESASPFIVPVTHAGERPGHDIGEPFKTITAANRGELGLVDCLVSGASVGVGGRAGQTPPRGLNDPVNTVTAKGDRAVVAATLAPVVLGTDNHSTRASRAFDVDDPMRTVTSAGGYGLAVANLAPVVIGSSYGDDRPGAGLRAWSPDEPARTVTSGGAGGFAVAAAHLTKFRTGSSGADVEEPMPTVTANSFVKRPGCGVPLGVVAAHLGRQFGTAVGRDLAEPHPTVMTDGAGGKSYVSTACLTSYYGNGDGADIEKPMPTVVTKDRHAPVVAFMEQANTGVVGHDAREPVSTLLAAGCHQRPVQASLEPVDGEPGSKRAKVVAFLREHFGEPTEAERDDPAGTLMARLRHGLVLIGKAVWQIADIGMRMLVPKELYGAQGFPADYIIDRTAAGPLTKTAQTRMAGNSVCPPWAAAIIAANDPLAAGRRAAA